MKLKDQKISYHQPQKVNREQIKKQTINHRVSGYAPDTLFV